MLKTNQSQKVSSIINTEFYLIGTLRLFDALKKHLIGYFMHLNLEELSSAQHPERFNNRKIDGVKGGGACQRSLCHAVRLEAVPDCKARRARRKERGGNEGNKAFQWMLKHICAKKREATFLPVFSMCGNVLKGAPRFQRGAFTVCRDNLAPNVKKNESDLYREAARGCLCVC